mmetsp:Transcript_63173/g.173398  ORF Transcript_63173/g.173398 Transcript_63173/m.173398 type:complete len:145 (+) Transcript_63173:886-1320(+)
MTATATTTMTPRHLRHPPPSTVYRPRPSAFAAGSWPGHGVVAVTQGLVDTLTTNELHAVIAHEIGHISHHDCGRAIQVRGSPSVFRHTMRQHDQSHLPHAPRRRPPRWSRDYARPCALAGSCWKAKAPARATRTMRTRRWRWVC